MTLDTQIKNIDRQITLLRSQREALVLLASKLNTFDEQLSVSTHGDYIDFDNLKRGQVVKLLSHLKSGKWKKEPGYESGKINYINETFLPDTKLRLYAAEPPASCKLVEEEIEIPAQPARKEKRIRLVCKDHELQTV